MLLIIPKFYIFFFYSFLFIELYTFNIARFDINTVLILFIFNSVPYIIHLYI